MRPPAGEPPSGGYQAIHQAATARKPAEPLFRPPVPRHPLHHPLSHGPLWACSGRFRPRRAVVDATACPTQNDPISNHNRSGVATRLIVTAARRGRSSGTSGCQQRNARSIAPGCSPGIQCTPRIRAVQRRKASKVQSLGGFSAYDAADMTYMERPYQCLKFVYKP